MNLFLYVFSYILMVPIDSEDLQGVVYVWVGSKADHDDATLTEEVAYMMYKVRTRLIDIFLKCILSHFKVKACL